MAVCNLVISKLQKAAIWEICIESKAKAWLPSLWWSNQLPFFKSFVQQHFFINCHNKQQIHTHTVRKQGTKAATGTIPFKNVLVCTIWVKICIFGGTNINSYMHRYLPNNNFCTFILRAQGLQWKTHHQVLWKNKLSQCDFGYIYKICTCIY